MYRTPNADMIKVQYTFINDDCLYETQSYNIIEDGTIKDHGKYFKHFGCLLDN